jgi:nitroimidazol reductase NimA-like FMN-containing flavoprotein (pyridoxamine 5'-phosphate oxidase superfamily)
MVAYNKELYEKIRKISDKTRFAVLATEGNRRPYTNLVGFILSTDLKELYFFTSKKTRKYKNILSNPNACLLIDTRDKYNNKSFLITAITIIGRADVIEDVPRLLLKKYLKKNKELKEFTESAFNVLIKVSIEKYIIVNRFQQIIEIEI